MPSCPWALVVSTMGQAPHSVHPLSLRCFPLRALPHHVAGLHVPEHQVLACAVPANQTCAECLMPGGDGSPIAVVHLLHPLPGLAALPAPS